MPYRKTALAFAAAVALAPLIGAASAQTRPAHLTVSQNRDQDADAGMYTTVQAAVNAAQPGQIIEIIDLETYKEQVTIDSTKHGITIRSKNPTGVAKPTIQWQDVTNRSPRNYEESKREGVGIGQSGNFSTCGALRVIAAQGVIIDGIAVDGVEAAPFGWTGVWNQKDPLFHANAAIALANASGAVIRNCELKNAYFGVSVKDRNTGGVFGNPNPADNDVTVPLSGFGKVGNHLMEHNRVHSNSLAFYFESAWDLGSTVRYNLVYDNYHTAKTKAAYAALPDSGNRATGAFLFKDMILSPVAIYNNTFFRNYANFYADWKVGAPHLIFNNIYGRSIEPVGTRLQFVDAMGIDNKFPYRMNNCLFSALADLKADSVYMDACKVGYDGQKVPAITQVRISNSFPNPPAGDTINCLPPIESQRAYSNSVIAPGGLLTDAAIPAGANLRWLETSRSIVGTDDLFVSTNPASPDFLRPKWDHPLVMRFIKNKGWGSAGAAGAANIRNSDGNTADIGAIPSTGQAPAAVARVKPSNVVLVSGRNATANFYITLESGEFNNPKISFLRWVAPLPYDSASVNAYWGASAVIPVPQLSISNITPPANAGLKVGNNTVSFTIPRALGENDEYGFFEIVLEGTDARGNTVTSDVGFLPYRELDYVLDIAVYNRGTTEKVTDVTAGQVYTLHVTPKLKSGAIFTLGDLKEITYDLLSDAAAFMWNSGSQNHGQTPGTPLIYDTGVPGATGQKYDVVFRRAGEETIMGAGLYDKNGQRLVFLGTADITVLAGPPAKVAFLSPVPVSQLGAGVEPPVINRGANYEVRVEVQDEFGNAALLRPGQQLNIVSESPAVGYVVSSTMVADPKEPGVYTAAARVADGAENRAVFDLVATVQGAAMSDRGRLRVGRSLDRLEVFYSDTGSGKHWQEYYDPSVGLSLTVGEWRLVTVKAVGPDTVLTSRTQPVVVEASNPSIILVADTSNPAGATQFSMVNGVAAFWLGARPGLATDVMGACIDVHALNAASGLADGSINAGGRCDINILKPSSAILRAVVWGDGHGRPDVVRVYFDPDAGFGGFGAAGGIPLPDTVAVD
ncbi:MAG: hypothetical protein LBH93_01925, partial [Chitinispirillales bacterium]|nr:hypothetical protein [Chitinispirillales bacterium]